MEVALSLCMIVRDEAELLPCCMESVRGVVDEIVVVDALTPGRPDVAFLMAQCSMG